MYNKSKDYNKLYDLVCDGNIAMGWVDYDWNRNVKDVLRDPVQIKRKEEWKISIGVRGHGYGEIDFWFKEKFKSEKEAFVWLCESCNLEWIDSYGDFLHVPIPWYKKQSFNRWINWLFDNG